MMLAFASTIFSFWAFTGAVFASMFGTLHILARESKLHLKNLISDGDKIYASDKLTVFGLDDEGYMILYSSKKALGFEENKLVVADKLQKGLKVHLKDWAKNGQYIVLFNGDPKFQLCADNLIGYHSTCEGATDVSLTYDSLW